jgi:hypothetical protein
VIPEAPFLFSIAALSASLAGLAGLVAALRRGTDLRPVDAFRLREIVEFAFANILFAVTIVPLTQLLDGAASTAVRMASVLAVVYVVATAVLLAQRTRRAAITRWWTIAAGGLDIVSVAMALATVVSGLVAAYEIVLVLLLARPMLAFVFVLTSFEMAPQQPQSGHRASSRPSRNCGQSQRRHAQGSPSQPIKTSVSSVSLTNSSRPPSPSSSSCNLHRRPLEALDSARSD